MAAVLSALLCGVLGCGGSTSGTGGVTIEGKLLTVDATPVTGVTVTILDTGDSAVTDVTGGFSIETVDTVTNPEFLFEGNGVNARVQVAEIEDDVRDVRVRFELSAGAVRSREVEIRSRRSHGEDDNASGGGSGGGSSGGSGGGSSGSGGSGGNDDGGDDDSSGGGSGGSGGGSGGDDGGSSGGGGDYGSSGGGSGGGDGSGGNNGGGSSGGSGGGGSERQNVDVTGTIEVLSATSVTVEGVSFVIDAETEIRDGEGRRTTLASLSVGLRVKAKGETIGGVTTAEKIEVEE